MTSYPSILGGCVKTLHPKAFGGILAHRRNEGDHMQTQQYDIPAIDLMAIDLYPFEETMASGASEQKITEKIGIGSTSLIRAGAKNFNDMVIVPSKNKYGMLQDILKKSGARTTFEERKQSTKRVFGVSSRYDTTIHQWSAK